MQAPQSPASQPFLTPKKPQLAQEGAQALPGLRLGRNELAVDGVVHDSAPSRLRELGADLLGEVVGQVTLVGRRAMHVVEIAIGRNRRVDRAPQLAGRWHLARSAAAPDAASPR